MIWGRNKKLSKTYFILIFAEDIIVDLFPKDVT